MNEPTSPSAQHEAPVKPESDSELEGFWAGLLHYITSAIVMFGDARSLMEKAFLSRKDYWHARDWIYRCEHLLRRLLFIDAVTMLREGRAFIVDEDDWSTASPHKSRSELRDTLPARGEGEENDDDPETWRVSFSLFPNRHAEKHARANTRAPRDPSRAYEISPITYKPNLVAAAREFAKERAEYFSASPASTRSVCDRERVAPRRMRGGAARSNLHTSTLPAVLASRGLARRFEALTRGFKARVTLAKRLAKKLAREHEFAKFFTRPTLSYFSINRRPGDHAVADAARLAKTVWRDFLARALEGVTLNLSKGDDPFADIYAALGLPPLPDTS